MPLFLLFRVFGFPRLAHPKIAPSLPAAAMAFQKHLIADRFFALRQFNGLREKQRGESRWGFWNAC
jgi:hypothetical protein